MGVFIDHVDRHLRQAFGCAVLVVHHVGRGDKSRARGAMALTAGVDFEFRAQREPEGRVSLHCTKMKDAEEPAVSWWRVQEVPLDWHNPGDGLAVDDSRPGASTGTPAAGHADPMAHPAPEATDGADDPRPGVQRCLSSLVLLPCEAPVAVTTAEPGAGLRGQQAQIYQVIEREAPVARDTLRLIAEEELRMAGAALRKALARLKERGLVVEVEGRFSLADPFAESQEAAAVT